MREVIAVDLDDVLSANAKGWIAYSNSQWGTDLREEDYQEHWGEIWDVDHSETERRANHFHESGVVQGYEHFEQAKPVLEAITSQYDLVITTSRRKQLKTDTEEWINQYFPGIFSDIRYAGMWDTVTDQSVHQTKAELCREIGASYLIDDQLKHCIAVARVGLRGLLFGNYPWNQSKDPLPDGVVRVPDWQSVAGQLGV